MRVLSFIYVAGAIVRAVRALTNISNFPAQRMLSVYFNYWFNPFVFLKIWTLCSSFSDYDEDFFSSLFFVFRCISVSRTTSGTYTGGTQSSGSCTTTWERSFPRLTPSPSHPRKLWETRWSSDKTPPTPSVTQCPAGCHGVCIGFVRKGSLLSFSLFLSLSPSLSHMVFIPFTLTSLWCLVLTSVLCLVGHPIIVLTSHFQKHFYSQKLNRKLHCKVCVCVFVCFLVLQVCYIHIHAAQRKRELFIISRCSSSQPHLWDVKGLLWDVGVRQPRRLFRGSRAVFTVARRSAVTLRPLPAAARRQASYTRRGGGGRGGGWSHNPTK